MKNYATAYKNSKSVVNEARAIDIDKEHRVILEAVKREFGVSNFNELSDDDRAMYKSLILEYWTPTGGMTENGRKFLNESRIVLSPESTDDIIKRYFQREVKNDATNYMYGVLSGNTNGQSVANLKAGIEEQIGRRLPSKTVKEWLYEILYKHLQSRVKSLKF